MKLNICTKCGITTDLSKCPECGKDTVIGDIKVSAKRIRVYYNVGELKIPFVKITKQESDVLDFIAKNAPFYILKYGEIVLQFLIDRTPKKKNPIIYTALVLTKQGLSFLKRQLNF